MSKQAVMVLVRQDPNAQKKNHPRDVELAQRAASAPPCWCVLVGAHRTERRTALSERLGVSGIAGQGINIFAPEGVADEKALPIDALAEALAHYLSDIGYRIPLKRASTLEVRLSEDIDVELLAAVVESAAVLPHVDVRIGDRALKTHLSWEKRRDLFMSPPLSKASEDLTGKSPTIERIRQQVDRYAERPFPVLIIGETGTGKEVVAQMLHDRSGRSGRFMAQNAAQLPPALADSLLFGHEKGAFTGAESARPGRIREAADGTFFLDEVFNLELPVQAKLLRALNHVEEGIIVVEPIGAAPKNSVSVHTRLLVSALRDPRLEPTAGGASMREDLFYRIAAGVIEIPPLRERLDDLPLLCEGLMAKLKERVEVSPEALEVLSAHNWPGNVRELRLVLMRALMDAPTDLTRLTADQLRAALKTTSIHPAPLGLSLPCQLDLELKRVEVATLRAAQRARRSGAESGRLVGMGESARNFPRRLNDAEKKLKEMEGSHDQPT